MINENIKITRENVGISQRELARRIDKTGQYISYLEKNENANPSIEVLNRIAIALDVPLSTITSGSNILLIPGNKRLTQKPQKISDEETLLCTIKLLDYAGLDIALSTDEIKRITRITRDLHKSLIEDIKLSSDCITLK